MLVPPLQPSSVVHVLFWKASPLTLLAAGLPTFAQNCPASSQFELVVEPGSGSSPNRLHGLPSGTGPA